MGALLKLASAACASPSTGTLLSDRGALAPTTVSTVEAAHSHVAGDLYSTQRLTQEQRRQKAVAMLGERPFRRSAFVAEELADVVAVMIAVRTAVGTITGEMMIARANWSPASFIHFLDELDDREAS